MFMQEINDQNNQEQEVNQDNEDLSQKLLDKTGINYSNLQQDSQKKQKKFYTMSEEQVYVLSPGTAELTQEQKTMDHQQNFKRSWWNKTFGPMKPGSLRGSIFVLMASALGAGCLALPNVYKQSGLIMGIFLTSGAAVLALTALYALLICSMKTQTKTYSRLVKHCFGKNAGTVLQICIIVYAFGVVLSYQILIQQFLQRSLEAFGVQISLNGFIYRMSVNIPVMILIYPFAIKRDFSSLRFVTLFGFIAILYLIFAIIVQSPWYIKEFFDYSNLHFFKFDLNLFISYSICLFSFTCFTVVFSIKEELENPKKYRIEKIFDRSILIEVILYLSLGIVGYLCLLEDTPDVIVNMKNLSTGQNWALVVGKLAMIIVLFFGMPINLNPGRAGISILIYGNEFQSKKTNNIITFVMLALATLIAIVFPKILVAFSFLGGVCSVLMSVTFPGLCWIKLSENKWTYWKNLILLFFTIILTACGYIAAILSLLKAAGVIDI